MIIKKGPHTFSASGLFRGSKRGDLIQFFILTGARTTASAAAAQAEIRGYRKASSEAGIDKIDTNRFCFIIQFPVDQVSKPIIFYDLIFIPRLIQSHAQRGPRSPALGEKNPDGADVFLILEEFLDHLICFLSDCKHDFLLLT